MKHKNIGRILNIVVAISLIVSIISCASMGTPSGGPRDYTPPKYKNSNPKNNQTGVKSKNIKISFDENIQLTSPGENIIISPPQKEMPQIKSNLKDIEIRLIDSLLPNTSYTIDFGSSIKDNNEGNVLDGFSLAFSTGEVIDSLQISGTVLNASDLEPVTGITIGLHQADDDTAFTTKPFIRVSKTDAYGNFSIKNLAEGEYKIYAVADADRNYMFNAPAENIAFLQDIIVPSAYSSSQIDTIYTDTTNTEIDTIISRNITKFLPDSLMLFSFNEGFKPQYLAKHERKQREKLYITLSDASKKIMELSPINFATENNDWFILERNITNDTLSFWIKDSAIYNLDTIQVTASYLKTDSLLNLVPALDTLSFIYRETAKNEKASQKRGRRGDKIDTIKVELLELTNGINGVIDIYASPNLTFKSPIKEINKEGVRLYTKVDTIWEEVKNFSFVPDSLSPRKYILKNRWDFEGQYKFEIDSTAISDIYGLKNGKINPTFKVRKSSEYSNLYVETQGVNSGAFAELLDPKDKVVRYATIKNGGAEFSFVKPGTYYVRLIIDSDNNKKFTTGNYKNGKQPEKVYYYPKPIELKPNWDIEQTWDVYALPFGKQKPYELIKNKPKDSKNRQNMEENDDPIYSNRPTTNLEF